MRITRLYHPEQLDCGSNTQLAADSASHLIRVLRADIGTPIILFNGDGFDYHCKTLDQNPKKTLVSIESRSHVSTESSLKTTLIQGISRHDRMEQSVQKSVELGVNRIIPVLCQRSNTRFTKDKFEKKRQHWNKIIISACEQSGRSVLPVIGDIASIDTIEQYLNPDAHRLLLNPASNNSLRDLARQQDWQLDGQTKEIEYVIGPEGGLNEEEVSLLESRGFVSIQFGPRTLRTETSGPAFLSVLQLLWGDF